MKRREIEQNKKKWAYVNKLIERGEMFYCKKCGHLRRREESEECPYCKEERK